MTRLASTLLFDTRSLTAPTLVGTTLYARDREKYRGGRPAAAPPWSRRLGRSPVARCALCARPDPSVAIRCWFLGISCDSSSGTDGAMSVDIVDAPPCGAVRCPCHLPADASARHRAAVEVRTPTPAGLKRESAQRRAATSGIRPCDHLGQPEEATGDRYARLALPRRRCRRRSRRQFLHRARLGSACRGEPPRRRIRKDRRCAWRGKA